MKKLLLCVAALLIAFDSITAQKQTETTRKAAERMNQGDLNGAIAVLDKAIERKKDLLEAYKMRAQFRVMKGDVDGTIADYGSAIEISPNDGSLYEQRAQFRMFRRDSQGALKDYDMAVANGVKNERVYTGRAMIKRDLGDFDGAILDYQAAIAANPRYIRTHLGLASLLERKGDTDAAIAHLQDFLDRYEQANGGKLPKTKAESFGERVVIERSGKDKAGNQLVLEGQQVQTGIAANTPEEAARQTEKFEQKLNLSLAFANLGGLYEKKGDLDKALINVEKAIKINANDNYPFGIRGKIRFKQGDYKGAVADFNVTLNASPTGYATFADRGIAYLMLNDVTAAQKDFERYLQRAPQAKEALEKRIAEAREKRLQQPQ